MGRVILVSNRVLDLRRAAQAGGVAVALADVVRTRPSLWFGWNGEIKPIDEIDVVTREGRIATVPLSPDEHPRTMSLPPASAGSSLSSAKRSLSF